MTKLQSTASPRRRRPLVAAAVALLAAALALPTSASALEPLPDFTYGAELTVPEDLAFNPTNEFIFPSVFHAGEHLADPLAEWYLYYAPHNDPGGIALMYADSLDGPWTEYAGNPIIEAVWSPHYTANHVSSPDAIWNAQEQQMFLYYHGRNDTTRYATTTDGVTFTYGGVAVDTTMLGATSREASYGRVFTHPDPASAYAYGMFFMENTTANSRRIRLAESVDGRSWTVRPTPIVTPSNGDGGNVSAANLWQWDGQWYVIYHNSTGNIMARTVDETLTTVGPATRLHSSSGVAPDTGRVAAPEIVTEGDTTYLFYEGGGRLGATIAYATAVTGPTTPPPFALAVTTSATTGCAAGAATLAVTVRNDSTAANDIRVTSSLGERKFTGVAAGASRTATFTAPGATLAAGSASVKAFARVDGVAHEQTWPVSHTARSC
ncbi:hypothetical protein AB0N73_02780 [Microbacterium sp. NPDC089189]|uniref:hypothetical protein n=1 Tax=Microbacterium sp. NPDC089189 TaxID=3154972 RepID=UPI0034442D57